MSSWSNATITTKGNLLLSKLITGGALEITRVVSGSGTVPITQLSEQTDVSVPRQELTIQTATVKGDGTFTVPVLLTNDGLTTEYTAHQIGFYATDPDDGEILYCIAQDETGESVPKASDSPGFSVEWGFSINYGNASTVSVTPDPAGLITTTTGNSLFAQKNHTHPEFSGASSSSDGSSGIVPAPEKGNQSDFLRGDGTWAGIPEYSNATTSSAGLMSAADKTKLDGISTGAQVNTVTGIKGNAESSYRTGNVNLTPANIGAAESSHDHSADNITSGTLPISRGGTGVDLSSRAAYSILRMNDSSSNVYSTPTGNGAFYATTTNGAPQFGTLPLAQGGTGGTTAQAARTNLGFSGAPTYGLWSGTNNLTSQLTISGIAANPGYNTLILVWKSGGTSANRTTTVLPMSYIPTSKSTIFSHIDADGNGKRFYAWKSGDDLCLIASDYIGSGNDLTAIYGRY